MSYTHEQRIANGCPPSVYTDPAYKSWVSMKQRCYNQHDTHYPNYGGRGISVCDEWVNNFLEFRNHVGPKPDKCTLDRIDVDGNYEPGNVRWANSHVQNSNTRRNNATVGVIYRPHCKMWTARMTVNRVSVLYKSFKSHDDAVKARKEAEVKYAVYI